MKSSNLALALSLSGLVGSGCVAAGLDTELDEDFESQDASLYVASKYLWPSPTIPVCWVNPSSAYGAHMKWTRDAVKKTWEANSSVRFVGWGRCEAQKGPGIRIRISDERAHSYVGTSGNGRDYTMALNFMWKKWNTGCQSKPEYCSRVTAVHEFGHALGFDHEQNRPDTPDWCESDAKSNSTGDTVVGPWDKDSVMNYCNPKWAGDGNLSKTDIQGVRSAYGTYKETYPCASVGRVSGPDRFATAAAISKSRFSSATTNVVLTKGADVAPDALAAGPLAKSLGGPLLLTATDALPASTEAELKRLKPLKVVIVGGEGAVSKSVEWKLTTMGYLVERIAGASRYDTAAKIAKRVGAPKKLAFVASGADANLVDALAASGPAAALKAPILLVTKDSIPAETAQALSSLGITRTYVAGGASAVSDAVLKKLPGAKRLAGSSRYDTAVAVAQAAVSEGVPAKSVFVGRGDRMPDALAAGALGQVLVLSTSTSLPASTQYFLAQRASKATLLGGTGALDANVARAACMVLR